MLIEDVRGNVIAVNGNRYRNTITHFLLPHSDAENFRFQSGTSPVRRSIRRVKSVWNPFISIRGDQPFHMVSEGGVREMSRLRRLTTGCVQELFDRKNWSTCKQAIANRADRTDSRKRRHA